MSVISQQNKFCFIHINNTGGATITELLKEKITDLTITGNVHSTLSNVLETNPEIRDYYKFAFVRHPYDWLVSMFSNIIMDDKHPDFKIINKLSFYQFIEWLGDVGLKRRGEDYWTLYKRQSDYVFYKGYLGVDDIYSFENLCGDSGMSNVNTLFLKLGFDMPKAIPVLNKSQRAINWDNLFDIPSYRLANKIFEEDFKNFKYKKNEF